MSETAWNWLSTGSGNAGTGGGVSTTYHIPSWQQGVPSLSTNGGSTTMRNFPDVAMVADAINIYADNGSSLAGRRHQRLRAALGGFHRPH